MIEKTNILKSAFNIIAHSTVDYRKYTGSVTSDFGVSSHSFTEWKSVKAIVQPGIVSSFGGKCIELKDYKDLGLDWSRRYITVWFSDAVVENAVDRNGSDQVRWNNGIYNVLQVENWVIYNGWQRAYCVYDKSEDQSES